MPHDAIFLAALQGGLLLGLIHGVNPCGHSWLVLAPFTAGSRDPGRVFRLTAAFILGTSLACMLIGLTLGGISMSLPASAQTWADLITFGVLVVLGVILLVKPTLLHHHDHDHEHGHDHDHDHNHDHDHADCQCHGHDHDHHHPLDHEHGHDHNHDHHHDGPVHSHAPRLKNTTAFGLFAFGFVNMIVPCPTAAIMYSYALRSGDAWRSSAVFGAYALGTGIALAGVIWAIYKTTKALRALDRPWIEPLVMRLTGVLVIGFAAYSLWATESAVTVFPEFFA